MIINNKDFDINNRPNIEIKYHTRNVMSDPNLTPQQKFELHKMEFLAYFIVIPLAIVFPLFTFWFLVQINKPISESIEGGLIAFLLTGLLGLHSFGRLYPYGKGYVGLTETEIHFREGLLWPVFYSPIKSLKFTDIKKICFQEKEYHVAFQRPNLNYAHLNFMGMNKSDWNLVKNRLLQIPGIEYENL